MGKSYKDYQREIAELQVKAEEARKAEKSGAIRQIKQLMADFQITLKDLGIRDIKTQVKPASVLPPKYRDPVSGAVWTGRGRLPQWAQLAKTQGKLDQFLIAKQVTEKVVVQKAADSAPSTKTARKGPVAKKKPVQRKAAPRKKSAPVAAVPATVSEAKPNS